MGNPIIHFKIPANTPKDVPKISYLKIKEEMIKTVTILVPPGLRALAGLQILYGPDQFFPEPKGEWFTGSGETLTFELYWNAPAVPSRITLKGYNDDEVYSHTFYIRFTTMKIREAKPVLVFEELVKRLKAFFGI